jgi:DNA-binding CsgD family transcriptional regulator
MGRYIASGLPETILQYLESQKAQDDPIMSYVMSTGRPIWLSKLQEEPHQWTDDGIERMNMALKFVGDGVLVPLYGPFHDSAYNYISFENPREFYDDIFKWQIQALLQAVHVKYCFIRESLRSNIKLTPRENDVLELITFGKTNPEIGTILGISSNTVTGYVKQIFLKLGVSDRVSAALTARAYSMGY